MCNSVNVHGVIFQDLLLYIPTKDFTGWIHDKTRYLGRLVLCVCCVCVHVGVYFCMQGCSKCKAVKFHSY